VRDTAARRSPAGKERTGNLCWLMFGVQLSHFALLLGADGASAH
jgi:hypothetical protein